MKRLEFRKVVNTIVQLSKNKYIPRQLHFPTSRAAVMPLEELKHLDAMANASTNLKKRR
jgi:hypothetical protein